jgi:hypothetical protein
MATKSDVTRVFILLKDAYPYYDPKNPDGIMSIWERKFSQTPAAVLSRAAELHIENSKFFPALAEILALLPKADREVSEEERKEAAGQLDAEYWSNVNALRERKLALEDAFTYERSLPVDAWQELAADFERMNWVGNADACRERIRTYQEILERETIPASIEVDA